MATKTKTKNSAKSEGRIAGCTARGSWLSKVDAVIERAGHDGACREMREHYDETRRSNPYRLSDRVAADRWDEGFFRGWHQSLGM